MGTRDTSVEVEGEEGEVFRIGTTCRWPREMTVSLSPCWPGVRREPEDVLREARQRAATLVSAEARWELEAISGAPTAAELTSALRAISEAETWQSMGASARQQRASVWAQIAGDAMELAEDLADSLDLVTDTEPGSLAWRVACLRAGSERQSRWLDAHDRAEEAAHARRVACGLVDAGTDATEILGLAVEQASAVWTALAGMQRGVTETTIWAVSDRRACAGAWLVGGALGWARGRPADDALARRVVDAWPTAMYERARRHGPLAMREALRAAACDTERRRVVLAWAGLLALARRARIEGVGESVSCGTVWVGADVEAILARALSVAERETDPGDVRSLARRAASGLVSGEDVVAGLLALLDEADAAPDGRQPNAAGVTAPARRRGEAADAPHRRIEVTNLPGKLANGKAAVVVVIDKKNRDVLPKAQAKALLDAKLGRRKPDKDALSHLVNDFLPRHRLTDMSTIDVVNSSSL